MMRQQGNNGQQGLRPQVCFYIYYIFFIHLLTLIYMITVYEME